jgi:Ala-tRNA(Pro) deacylase
MAVTARLQRYLDRQGVPYAVLSHRATSTAHDAAAAAHVSDWEMAKVLVGRDEAGFVMVVLPASCDLNLPLLRRVTGRRQLVLASEGEIRELFPDCEVGAIPPFGKLYGLPVYADRCLATSGEVLFAAGNHREEVRLAWRDFVHAAEPIVTDFCRH